MKRTRKRAPPLARVPPSHATNAYDLLEDVKKAIQEEPKRIDMAHWILKRTALKRKGRKTIPACGTVGCIAGWVTVLAGRDTSAAYSGPYHDEGTLYVKDIARNLLADGQDWEIRNSLTRLFYGYARGDVMSYGRPGTKAHAARVVEDITTFQKQYEPSLKARQVVPQEQHA